MCSHNRIAFLQIYEKTSAEQNINVECGLRSWLFPKGGKAISRPKGRLLISYLQIIIQYSIFNLQ